MNCIHFLFPKCARGKECESIVIHIQHFVFKDCAWKVSKLNNKFGFLWLFYKMQVLQICKHSLHVNICLSWWAVVSCMCFVSDLQENEEKFTLFGLIFPQSKNNIYSINCIKPCICVINGRVTILVTKNIKIEYFNASRKMQYFTFYGQKLHLNANGRYLVDNGEVLSLFYIAINKISHTCKSINKFYGQFYFHQKK